MREAAPHANLRGPVARGVRLAAIAASAAILIAACGSSGSSGGSSSNTSSGSGKGNYTIALSDSFIGNDWRKTMVKGWEDEAKAAQRQGLIKSYRVDVTAQNTAAAQIAQIQSLILAHVDAIDIDSASPTALNPVIQQACAQGIKVVVFDSLASAPCEYNLADPFPEWGKLLAETTLKAMHYKGNLLVVQGVVGSAPNNTVMGIWKSILKKYPAVHVVATVDGENASSTTEQAVERVLPSLPHVDGVLIQTGADGAIHAFQALGKPLPAIAFDTDGTTMRIAQQLHEKTGFSTTALLTDPGQGTAAFWESVLLLQGKKFNGKAIPHNLNWPLVLIPQAKLPAWLKVTPPTTVASWLWTMPEVEQGIQANLAGHSAAPLPVPTQSP